MKYLKKFNENRISIFDDSWTDFLPSKLKVSVPFPPSITFLSLSIFVKSNTNKSFPSSPYKKFLPSLYP